MLNYRVYQLSDGGVCVVLKKKDLLASLPATELRKSLRPEHITKCREIMDLFPPNCDLRVIQGETYASMNGYAKEVKSIKIDPETERMFVIVRDGDPKLEQDDVVFASPDGFHDNI